MPITCGKSDFGEIRQNPSHVDLTFGYSATTAAFFVSQGRKTTVDNDRCDGLSTAPEDSQSRPLREKYLFGFVLLADCSRGKRGVSGNARPRQRQCALQRFLPTLDVDKHRPHCSGAQAVPLRTHAILIVSIPSVELHCSGSMRDRHRHQLPIPTMETSERWQSGTSRGCVNLPSIFSDVRSLSDYSQ